MPSVGTLVIGIVAGSIGVGYFVYGKRQQRLAFIFAGVGLCVVPYLVDGVATVFLLSALLAAAPFAFRD